MRIKNIRRFLISHIQSIQTSVARPMLRLLPTPTSRIYDCFLFYNELELLELRLAELYDIVDYFIIAECRATFSGTEKPLFYAENQERFKRYHAKIRHVVIEDPPVEAYVENPANLPHMTSEFWQRNQMRNGFKDALPNDTILISDVDEIPRSDKIRDAITLSAWGHIPVIFAQRWHVLFLNARVIHSDRDELDGSNAEWFGTVACKYKMISRRFGNQPNSLWAIKWGRRGSTSGSVIDNAGWHFSYMGGIDMLLSKMSGIGLRKYTLQDVEDIRNRRFIELTFQLENIDATYPLKLQRRPENYAHLIANDSQLDNLANDLERVILQSTITSENSK